MADDVKKGPGPFFDRTTAQQRVQQIRAFQSELEALEAAGVAPLAPEQKAAIGAYHAQLLKQLAAQYDVDRSDTAGQLSRGMRLLSFFAALALTAAVYSLVERFWSRLDLPLQSTLLAVFPLVALVGVELSARRERTLYVASLFALVAYGTFWLAVGVLSWTLNIPLTPGFIWVGVLFGLALAVPYGLRIILAAALATLAVAIAASMFQAAGAPWTEAFNRPDLLTAAAFSLLLLGIPLAQVDRAFAAVTRLVALGIGLTGFLVLSMSGATSVLPVSSRTSAVIYQTLMFVVCIAALVVAIRRGWTETVHLVSVMFAWFLLDRFVDWFWDVLPRYVFFSIVAALAFIWLLLLRRIRGRLTETRT